MGHTAEEVLHGFDCESFQNLNVTPRKTNREPELMVQKREKLTALIVFALISTETEEEGRDGDVVVEMWAEKVVCSQI